MAVYESKNPTKDGRKYFFRIKYKDILGNVHDYNSQKFKAKADAINAEALYRVEMLNKEMFINDVTIDSVFNQYFLKHKQEVKKQTEIKIKNHYKYLSILSKVKVNNLKYDHIKILKQQLDNANLSVAYKNKILGLFERLIKFSNKYYNTSSEILKFCDKYKEINMIKKEMDYYTLEEYKQFDSVIDNFHYHIFFEILFYLGLRKGEAQALTWKDIDFKKEELKITKTLTTKIKGEKWTITSPKTKNSTRTLPVPKNVLNDLKKLHNEAKSYTDYNDDWFVFGFSCPFKESTIFFYKNKYSKLAGVKEIRIHDFRHSCASLLINSGASISLVSKYLGHSNISITLNIYTHFYQNELNSIKNLIGNM